MGNQERGPEAAVIEWLRAADEPWVVYNTLLDLIGADPGSPEVTAAYAAMQADPRVAELLTALDPWPPEKQSSGAYDAKDSIWKLGTLGDFGVRRDDPRIAALAERVFAAQAEDGGFLQGGFDHTKTWNTRPYMCVAHVMTYALARFGYLDDPRLAKAYDQIAGWQRLDGGWHPNQQLLPGAAREADPSCPFGTLNVLRALVANPAWRDSAAARRSAANLLECWARRAEPYRPVGFGIGSTWDKTQYPFVQYQLLKTVDTLAQVPAVRGDARFGEMLDRLRGKQGTDGRWTAESVNKPWSAFDFGQKKQPSAWITFLAVRAVRRGTAAPAPAPGL
jgi:hypothetical protein